MSNRTVGCVPALPRHAPAPLLCPAPLWYKTFVVLFILLNTYVYIYIYIYMYVYIHTYMYIYIYIYMYTYAHSLSLATPTVAALAFGPLGYIRNATIQSMARRAEQDL